MKIAVNKCLGVFSVSRAIYDELEIEWDGYGYLNNDSFGLISSDHMEWRKYPKLIEAIEKIGENASSGDLAEIRIIDIPDNIEYEICEYDGIETIHEVHRSW